MTFLPVYRFDRQLLEIPGRMSGRIEHVYRNTAVVGCGADEPLLAFLRPGSALVPCGIEFPWKAMQPRSGMTVAFQDRSLRIGDLRPVVLKLSGQGKSLRPAALGSGWSADALGEKLSMLRLPARSQALLGLLQGASRQERRVMAQAVPGLKRLTSKLRDGSRSAAVYRELVDGLAGLGPGSTPTGDDILAGVAALAWRLASAGTLSARSMEEFRAALGRLAPGVTTRTGREMLAHAARGAFYENLLGFADVLGQSEADQARVNAVAGRLGRTGGRSGCDMLAGVVSLAGAVAKGGRA